MKLSGKINLLKTLSATTLTISSLILFKILLTTLVGGILDCFLALEFTKIIGQSVSKASVSV
ncbi:MAG: hypothetical protein LBV77_01815 [Candidatus Adiutrix intracellularis]|nr:hypothetical protein [Candidatus Adiutrix intracellularis]